MKVVLYIIILLVACNHAKIPSEHASSQKALLLPDTLTIPENELGEAIRYGRTLLLFTNKWIGPNGLSGSYTGNKMNCTNCHQDAGTKPFSFNLMRSHQRYPQYRARENKVISLAERINNCIERPHLGRGLPFNSKEMVSILAYLKWINMAVVKLDSFEGEKNLPIQYPNRMASWELGRAKYEQHCLSCHGSNGEGQLDDSKTQYIYPPLCGNQAYQTGSSMHRVSIFASWIKANMPHLKATWEKPVLSDEDALDIAAFVNNDSLHYRRVPKELDYPNPKTKPFDYDRGPFYDTFSVNQHKYGPFLPIIAYKAKNR